MAATLIGRVLIQWNGLNRTGKNGLGKLFENGIRGKMHGAGRQVPSHERPWKNTRKRIKEKTQKIGEKTSIKTKRKRHVSHLDERWDRKRLILPYRKQRRRPRALGSTCGHSWFIPPEQLILLVIEQRANFCLHRTRKYNARSKVRMRGRGREGIRASAGVTEGDCHIT